MRKAEGKYHAGVGVLAEFVTGYFHCWANEYDEFEAGPGNSTVALIEDEKSGNIRVCAPRTVTFLEAPKP